MPTALITGASAGIGEEFARQLAARGYELVLVARREDRLARLAERLPTAAHVVTCDLTTEATELAGRVEALGVEVDLLVNNAGFGLRGRVSELPADQQAAMVRVNCEAVLTLTCAFLPAMLERRRGGIIVVASSAGMQPLPYEAVYGASKAFAVSFSEALHAEARGSGVRVLAVNPGPVPTEWQQVAGYTEGDEEMPGTIEADQVVREALAAYDKGRRAIVPGRFFRNLMRLSAILPRSAKLAVTERRYRPKR